MIRLLLFVVFFVGQPLGVTANTYLYDASVKHVSSKSSEFTSQQSNYDGKPTFYKSVDRFHTYNGGGNTLSDAFLAFVDGFVVTKGTKSLKEQASDLIPLNNGKHRVTLRSEKQQLEIDLAGKDHAGIPTPHTKISPRNTQAPDHLQPVFNTRKKHSTIRASTQEEIRAARKFLEGQNR